MEHIKYTALSGMTIINTPTLNKGTAFSKEERKNLGLNGLLPNVIENIDSQISRIDEQFNSFSSCEDKYVYLRALQDRNEVLFYKYITENIQETMPIIYTPTVGYGCQRYSHIFRKSRGLYISINDSNNIDEILQNVVFDDIKIIVVTDGERILGLGDLGICGMGIPIGKLSLYVACGGIDPSQTLPIVLDVGTNNEKYLKDPLYLGIKEKRIHGDMYYDFIDHFVKSIFKRWPHVLLQFEDFSFKNATPILKKYKDKYRCFNDDIQGTAAVALSCIISSSMLAGRKIEDNIFLFVGAGTAGCGIAYMLVNYLVSKGHTEAEAKSKIFLYDKNGLLVTNNHNLETFQVNLAKENDLLDFNPNGKCLKDLISLIKPTVLFGVSGQGGLFSKDIICEMYKTCNRPIVLPISNPTSCAEAIPSDIIEWTDGNAIISTGSPFHDVVFKDQLFVISQCNNSYIFPGVGLGVVASKATRVTDKMLMAASERLATFAIENKSKGVLPPLNNIATISKEIAICVGETAVSEGVSNFTGSIRDEVNNIYWNPAYPVIKYKSIS